MSAQHTSQRTAAAVPRRVLALVAAMIVAATALTAVVAPLPAPSPPNWFALPLLGVLLVAATWFVVPFRYGHSVDAVNLVEAALAPLLLTFPPLVVIVVAVISQIANGLLRRLPWIKTTFNAAMWALAGGLGAATISLVGPGPVWPQRLLGLLAALVVVGLVNNLAFAAVMALVEDDPLRRLVARVGQAWVAGWVANAALGLLFALAYLASPAAVPLFVVPLLVLHLAYRNYSAARADQARLVAAHDAAVRLSAPLYPLAAMPYFLRAVAECFNAPTAELVLRNPAGGRDIHRVDGATGDYTRSAEGESEASLAGLVAAIPGAVQLSAHSGDAVSRALGEAGVTTCMAAPLLHAGRLEGALLVLDRGGFEGSRQGELAVLETLARETSSALAKGRLLADVLDERRKLAEIVETTSDGILTLTEDGTVLTWNSAMEHITGLASDHAVGKTGVPGRLRLRTLDGEPVELTGSSGSYPEHILITATDGMTRHLACSYSTGAGRVDGAALVVVARDVTPADEHEALREQMTQLVQEDAARRTVVEQLQQAVVPADLSITGGQVSVAYEASDPSAPTGGDLYDWQVLPSGEIHIAVVDVLGHGVAATKDALAVVHTLRVVTAAGTPLEHVIARADELLGAQSPELVATVVVARFDPSTGRLRIASGGHPPAIIITPRREVRQVAASGGVIGWPGAGSDDVAETVLEPGDALVLYTDGLVEARKNILDGIAELERHAAQVADLPAADLARELVDRALSGADRRDDTLALVLRRDYVSVAEQQSSWSGPPTPAAARDLRRSLGSWLAGHDLARDDVLLVAAELLANAARAGRSRIALHVALTAEGIVLDVSDDGAADLGITERGTRRPDARAERGRGLYLVRSISAHVDVLATAEGTTIRATLPRTPPRPVARAPTSAPPDALLAP
jgi:PAS domain S-box-containing protein